MQGGFTANGSAYKGIIQDISFNGLSTKTEHQLGSDTMLDIVIELAGNETSKVKGKVTRTIKYGLGVKIIERDSAYLQYYKCLEGMELEFNR